MTGPHENLEDRLRRVLSDQARAIQVPPAEWRGAPLTPTDPIPSRKLTVGPFITIGGAAAALAVGALAIVLLGGRRVPSTGTASQANGQVVSVHGVAVRVPNGWHAAIAEPSRCDPEELLSVSSAPLHLNAAGQPAAPAPGQVLILVLEDRFHRPLPQFVAPQGHFAIPWNERIKLQGCSISERHAVYLRYFRSHHRYVGFAVYAGERVSSPARAAALAVIDSLTVGSS